MCQAETLLEKMIEEEKLSKSFDELVEKRNNYLTFRKRYSEEHRLELYFWADEVESALRIMYPEMSGIHKFQRVLYVAEPTIWQVRRMIQKARIPGNTDLEQTVVNGLSEYTTAIVWEVDTTIVPEGSFEDVAKVMGLHDVRHRCFLRKYIYNIVLDVWESIGLCHDRIYDPTPQHERVWKI